MSQLQAEEESEGKCAVSHVKMGRGKFAKGKQ